MHPILKNILIVISALIVAMTLMYGIEMLGGQLIQWPEGVDRNDFKSIKDNFHLFQPVHFIVPFLSHAIGAFAAAWIVSKWAASHHFRLAMLVGVLFLMAGIMNITMLRHPLWFIILDLGLAYIPTAYLTWKINQR